MIRTVIKAASNYYVLSFALSFVIVVVGSIYFIEDFGLTLAFFTNSLSWLALIFVLPLWISVFTLKRLRQRNVNHVALEVLIVWLLFMLGALVKFKLDSPHAQLSSSAMTNIASMTLWWTAFFYGLERFVAFNRRLLNVRYRARKFKHQADRFQINPHMLFNSINAISNYIYQDPVKADQMLHDLSDLLRYTLTMAQRERVPVYEEIDVLRKYVKLEQARFGERISCEFCIQPECSNVLIPPLIIQPLVENAIKHNSNASKLNVFVKIYIHNQKLVIRVSDDGRGFDQISSTKGFGIGLTNIQSQIAGLKQGMFEIYPQSDELGDGASIVMSFAV